MAFPLATFAPADPPADLWRFDAKRADRVQKVIEEVTVHTKGRSAREPFILADWQRDEIVRPLFGTVMFDDQLGEWVRQYRLAWIEMARKNGKMLHEDTPIFTGNEWKRIADLAPGDVVYASTGEPTTVEWVSDLHSRPGFRVTLASGRSVLAADTHRWSVSERVSHGRVDRVVTTAEMLEAGLDCPNGRRWAIDVQGAADSPANDLPVHPYLLGVWLGDGSSASAQITGIDPEIFTEIESRGYTVRHHADPRSHWVTGMLPAFRELGVLGNKHVPAQYATGSIAQRLDLLRGLMDSDGTVIVGLNTPRVEFCNTDEGLAFSVLELARSLGFKATIKESRATLNGRDIGPRWRVCWTAHDDDFNPFGLPRKARLLPRRPAAPTRASRDMVVSIEPVGDIRGVCIAVDHPTHTFLAGREFIPTHNSELLSALALYALMFDGEESAEVYSVALDRDQAGLVFNVAKRMVEMSPFLSKRLEVIDSKRRIIHRPSNSVYQVLPGDAGGALGTNPSCVLFDEILTQRNRELWDAMRQGFGTRREPLLIAATTAAYTSARFALEEHDWSERVKAKPELDRARFVFMRNTPKDWDWRDEGDPPSKKHPKGTGWYYSNPALGDFLNINQLRGEAEEAKEKPTAQNAFRVFRLNQWTAQAERWLDMQVWADNGSIPVDPELMRARRCFGGLDLAANRDLCAWVMVFPGSPEDEDARGFTVLPRFWLPRAAMDKRTNMREQLAVWEESGHLLVTEGHTTDYDAIEHQVGLDAEQFDIASIGYDPWNATQVVGHLEGGGLTMVKVPQTAPQLNDPSKLLESLLVERRFWHGGHPVLEWNADNVQAVVNSQGHMKPDKENSGEKIDGIAATLNALYVAVIPVEDDESVSFISFAD